MKNLILLFAVLCVIQSCNKDNDSQSNNSRIVIKGTISGDNHKSFGFKPADQISPGFNHTYFAYK